MSWIVAESLERLRQQLNALAPNRSKASDGGIGDAAHASRNSDHDPWYGPGIVTARDFTNDPAGGLDCFQLRDALIRSKDSRIKYLIFNRQIVSGNGGPQPWVRRPYTGENPHTKHLHLSVVADKRCRDGSPWLLPGITSPVTPAKYPTLQRGSSGPAVGIIQRFLGVTPVSEFFGPATEAAVKAYQKMRGLTADGVVGSRTWKETGL